MRVARNELNIVLELTPRSLGVFEQFYDDSIYKDVSTRYVNSAYEIEREEIHNLLTLTLTEQYKQILMAHY